MIGAIGAEYDQWIVENSWSPVLLHCIAEK